MKTTRQLPSYFVPKTKIKLGVLTISKSDPIVVLDDWHREHYAGSIKVEEEDNNGKIHELMPLHSLLINSRLGLYVIQSNGSSHGDFSIHPLGISNVNPREIVIDYNDILDSVYGVTSGKAMSYKSIYENYLASEESYLVAVKNYFLAQDVNFNKRLRTFNTSYWQVVMLMSAMEALLPKPEFCKGECSTCKTNINHVTAMVDKDWNELLFKRIKDKEVRKQYRLILDVARTKIRNDTVHNGLAPSFIGAMPVAMPDGITEYTTEKAIEEYGNDSYSLESLIDQLEQICRYLLLNQIIREDVFPPLKGIEVHSQTFTNITTSTATFKLDMG